MDKYKVSNPIIPTNVSKPKSNDELEIVYFNDDAASCGKWLCTSACQ